MKYLSLLAMAAILFATACKKDKEGPMTPIGGGTGGTPCNNSYLPILMLHGLLASGDTYANQAQRFVQNGQCSQRVFVMDRNTLGGGSTEVPMLDAFIDSVLQLTGATQLELVGHSAGGSLGYNYLADATRAAKVAHYVHIGSGTQPGPAGPNGEVPTMNIWSPYDAIASAGDIPGAENVQLADKDHYQVATSAEAFAAMYTFFRGASPASSTIVPDGRREVSGRALSLGENVPLVGATINVFPVNTGTGFRIDAQPAHVFTTDAKGYWGSFGADEGTYYEFEVIPAGTGRKLHYYREPFIASDALVYLRSLPSAGSVAGLLVASLPSNDDQAVLTIFTENQAVVNGRDDLRSNGTELSTPEFASADNTTIAFFLYDDNNDGQTNGNAVGLFSNFPFLSGIDVFFPSAQQESIELTFAGRTMRVRNWPSASEGVTIAVFN